MDEVLVIPLVETRVGLVRRQRNIHTGERFSGVVECGQGRLGFGVGRRSAEGKQRKRKLFLVIRIESTPSTIRNVGMSLNPSSQHSRTRISRVPRSLEERSSNRRRRMGFIRRLDQHAERGSASTFECAEERGVGEGVGGGESSVGEDDGELEDVVDSETVEGGEDGVACAHDPASACTDGSTGSDSTDEGDVVLVGEVVGFSPGCAGGDGDSCVLVD